MDSRLGSNCDIRQTSEQKLAIIHCIWITFTIDTRTNPRDHFLPVPGPLLGKEPGELQSIIFESNSHLTRIESEAFSKSSLRSILTPRNVEIVGSKCFYNCKSLSSISFESNSHLTRIESEAFWDSSLQSILILMNVEILGSKCFSRCKSLSSITFESNSHLTGIESNAFSYSSLQSI
jgi:hypothetical protein